MTTKELKKVAKDLKVKNWWNLKKEELIAAIETAQNEPEPIQDEPELIEEPEPDKLSAETESPLELNSELFNGWEEIAKKNIIGAYDWIVGENENTLQDYEEDSECYKTSFDYLYSGDEIINDIYHAAITSEYDDGYCGGKAPKEMRFAGKEFCINLIKDLLKKDGYIKSLKQYAAWVKDRETKELTRVFGEAISREEFYRSIKDKYRVRLITKPEKIEEECKQWEIRHAHNKKIKNEKYAADKAKAKEMSMTVAEYRKVMKNHE